MADFYLDHDVALPTANLLISHGDNARSAASLGLGDAEDGEHLLIAARQHWILVTHNWADFHLLHYAWKRWFEAFGVLPVPAHAGILVIPQHRKATGWWSPERAAGELHEFVASGVRLTNELYRWRIERQWVRIR